MKLYFGTAVTMVTTLMTLALLGFIGVSVWNRAEILYWGRRSAVLLLLGLAVCCLAAARDGQDKTIQNAIDGSCAPGLFPLVSVPTVVGCVGARLLIAADCTAYAYAAFHERFIKGHITLVGCPKLDSVDYSEKLTEIIRENDIKSVTVVRMEVPCCGGLEVAAKKALQQSGKFSPWQVVTVTVDGRLKED